MGPRAVSQHLMSSFTRRDFVKTAAWATLTAPALAAVLESAEAAMASGSFAPRVLSPEQLEQVATIAEHIIPATDTPGARAAGVHRFIDTMLAEYYSSEERKHLLNGLADVDARARGAYGRAFLACADPNQRALLEQLDRETFAGPATATLAARDASRETERGGGGLNPGAVDTVKRTPNTPGHSFPPFFRTMKELTLLGYYTSQPGATKELRYLQVPGRFDGCVPFAKVGRAWAT